MTRGPNNILALSSATSHGFRQSTRVLAGMSLGFFDCDVTVCGHFISLAVIDPAAVHRELGRGGIYCLAGVENRPNPTKGRRTSGKTNQLFGPAALQFVKRQNHFVRCYGTVDVCSAANTGAKLGGPVNVSVLLAMVGTFGNVCWALAGHLFQRLFRQLWSPVKYRACPVAGLLRGTHFSINEKKERSPSSA